MDRRFRMKRRMQCKCSGVAQRQSSGLLIHWSWVRIPPPEPAKTSDPFGRFCWLSPGPTAWPGRGMRTPEPYPADSAGRRDGEAVARPRRRKPTRAAAESHPRSQVEATVAKWSLLLLSIGFSFSSNLVSSSLSVE